jgi:lycopene beta-cyclase
MDAERQCDLAIVGGGLAGGLTALAVRAARPEARIVLVEPGERLGGHHIWSFFDSDVEGGEAALLAPLVAHAWRGYEVRFPAFARTLGARYHSITSERFDAVLRERLPADAIVRAEAVEIRPDGVTLSDGRRLIGPVIDARGPGDLSILELGWQKFVGQELRLADPHGLDQPTVMDATVEQRDGYRFVYLLPFAADRVFVEDTYYSDTPDLDRADIEARIAAYATARGWRIEGVERSETGALPVVLGGDFDRYWASTGAGVAKAGLRAGLFHPTTGYSLPDAARLARRIAAMPDWRGLAAMTRDHARAAWEGRGFYRLLDRMLFRAADPGQRYKVLQRFYRLDERLVGRFYAARSTALDKARLLAGRPPVPIGRALKAVTAR